MKKIVLSLAGVMAAVAFAPEASAIPAFARQTGMACSACHYQHFPVINGFGRAFKEGGFTMMGAEEKIEGEGLSIPANLNLALVGYMSYAKTNGTTPGVTATTKDTNSGSLQIPQQVSLFAGGRVAENIGFEAEINIAGPGTTLPIATGTGLIRFKMPFVFDVAGVKAGVVPFSTGLGVADSMEVLNTGAVAVHAFNQSDMSAISAQQYIGTATAANGAALVASNDSFFANVAKWGASQGVGASGGPTSNYVRGAYLTSAIPGFDSAIGFQSWSGTSVQDGTAATGLPLLSANGAVATRAAAIDAQMLGDVAGMPLTLVASFADAPGSANAASVNLFNQGLLSRRSANFGAELGVIPNVATVQFGLRRAYSGVQDAATGANLTDNAVMLGATYAFALNVRAELTYSRYSGGMYSAAQQQAQIAAAGAYMGNQQIMMDLAFGF
jgi:hypothetical protein